MKSKIFFYGPVNGRVGGGEAGNQKTISLLNSLGFEVVVIEKPVLLRRGLFDYIIYFLSYISIFKELIFKNRTYNYIHISGFYASMIYIEFLVFLLAKFSNLYVVYEIRAGGAIMLYEERSMLYKYFFDTLIKKSDLVFSQGEIYIDKFGHLNKNFFYYPNFVVSDLIPDVCSSRLNEIVYFGRISASKNLEFIFDVLDECDKRGVDIVLKIIGEVEPEYSDKFYNRLSCYSPESVKFLGAMEFEFLIAEVSKSKYFLFPTKEPREGHSNALTEAMACGVVPIVSNYGFNASVVANDRLVVNSFNPVEYADKICEISSEDYIYLSEFVRKRVFQLYTEKKAIKVLKKGYFCG